MNPLELITKIESDSKTDSISAAKAALELLERLYCEANAYERSQYNRSLESFKDGIENLRNAITTLHE